MSAAMRFVFPVCGWRYFTVIVISSERLPESKTPQRLQICHWFVACSLRYKSCLSSLLYSDCLVALEHGWEIINVLSSGSVAEWLACWTQAQLRARVQIAAATLSGNCLRQTVHIHRASVLQAAKLVAVLLRVAGITAGLAESNGSLPPGLWLTPSAGWLPRTGISSGTLRRVIEYRLPLPFLLSSSANVNNPG